MKETVELNKEDDVYTIWVKIPYPGRNISIRSLCITKKTAKQLMGLLKKEFDKKKKGADKID